MRPSERSRKQVLRLPEVVAKTGISRKTTDRKMAVGKFPKSFPLGERAVGWFEQEVDAWIDTMAASG